MGICPAIVIPRREVVTELQDAAPPAGALRPGEVENTHLVQGTAPAAPPQLEPLTPNLQRLHDPCVDTVPREARRRAEGSRPRAAGSLGREGHRGHARPPAGAAGNTPGRRQGATEGLPPDDVRPRHRRGEARGLDARRRQVHVANRFRRRLRFDAASGDRPRRPARQGRRFHGRELSPRMRHAPHARRPPGLRRRLDGPVHRRCREDLPIAREPSSTQLPATG